MKDADLSMAPVSGAQRHVFLDVLRGFALLGVCLANYPEFSLYTFQSADVVAAMPSAGADRVVRFLQYLFVDGKFYTLFSLLFGVGFSIIISHAAERGADGFRIFYRRMALLAVFGFLHLMFVWSGDILLLYAVLGMLLPLFRRMSDRRILTVAGALLFLPVAVDAFSEVAGISLAQPAVDKWWYYAGLYGITEENFGFWLRDAESYRQVFEFLIQGAWERMSEFIDGNRYFKVMGLFLTGFVIGRHRVYAELAAYRPLLRKLCVYGMIAGIPLSVVYAASAVCGYPLGRAVHTLLYTVSVYPLAFAYAALLGLVYLSRSRWGVWKWLAAPGRMALTNYIGQSVIGMFLFYGIGFGLGASLGLGATEAVALAVFAFEVVFCRLWLLLFRFGPLEWVWRMLTYGKPLRLVKDFSEGGQKG